MMRHVRTMICALIAFVALSATAEVTLTVYYDFEGEGDDRLDDPAGSHADNLFNYNVAFSSEAPVGGGTQSARFNGDSALFTDAYSSDLGPDADAYTIMLWLKGTDAEQENSSTRVLSTTNTPDETAATNPDFSIDGFGNDGTNGRGLRGVFYSADSELVAPSAWYRDSSIVTGDKRIGAVANEGQVETWRHVAFVMSNSGDPTDGGAYVETYIDGRSAGITSADAAWDGLNIANTTGQLILGSYKEVGTVRDYTGLMDEVAMFAGVVSATEIQAIYEGTLSPADWLVSATNAEIVRAALENYFPDETDEAVVGFGVDPDGDGIINAFEVLYGLSPLVHDSSGSGLNYQIFEEDETRYFQLEVDLSAEHADQLDWQIEWSADLGSWAESESPEISYSEVDGVRTLRLRVDLNQELRFARISIDE